MIYKRIILKISGESLCGDKNNCIDINSALNIAKKIKELSDLNIELGIIVGGGNIIRGVNACKHGFERATADYMGMLSTVINAMALQNSLESLKVPTRVLTAIDINKVAEPYIRRRAIRHLEKKRVVILAGGTGNPFVSTDTAAALRALELNAEVIFKATKVDGVYDADPMKDKTAKKFERLSYHEVLKRKLNIMDLSAISMCMEKQLPIVIFNLWQDGLLKRAVMGENVGTIISDDEP